MDILVIVEDNHGAMHRLSKEAIAGAQTISDAVSVLVIGENFKKISTELEAYDLSEIITVKHDLVLSYNADGYTEVVSKVVQTESPRLVIAGHTYQTRDFMPRISARLNIPFIPDIISISDHKYIKQVLNAKLNATCSANTEKLILSFQSAAFSLDNLKSGSCEQRAFDIELDSSIVRSVSEKPFQEASGDVDLEGADILVSVGRGIEKEENIHLAFELAEALNAEVSASRPVVDSGWIDSFRQVGSSGSNVAPKLYFSVGISGAIQHVVGMKGSKNILAINKDKDAPIFEIADYAIIGDVLDILPKLTEKLKED